MPRSSGGFLLSDQNCHFYHLTLISPSNIYVRSLYIVTMLTKSLRIFTLDRGKYLRGVHNAKNTEKHAYYEIRKKWKNTIRDMLFVLLNHDIKKVAEAFRSDEDHIRLIQILIYAIKARSIRDDTGLFALEDLRRTINLITESANNQILVGYRLKCRSHIEMSENITSDLLDLLTKTQDLTRKLKDINPERYHKWMEQGRDGEWTHQKIKRLNTWLDASTNSE